MSKNTTNALQYIKITPCAVNQIRSAILNSPGPYIRNPKIHPKIKQIIETDKNWINKANEL